MKLPAGLKTAEDRMKMMMGDSKFNIVQYIIRRYNEEQATLDEIADEIGINFHTLYSHLGRIGLKVSKQIVPVHPVSETQPPSR